MANNHPRKTSAVIVIRRISVARNRTIISVIVSHRSLLKALPKPAPVSANVASARCAVISRSVNSIIRIPAWIRSAVTAIISRGINSRIASRITAIISRVINAIIAPIVITRVNAIITRVVTTVASAIVTTVKASAARTDLDVDLRLSGFCRKTGWKRLVCFSFCRESDKNHWCQWQNRCQYFLHT